MRLKTIPGSPPVHHEIGAGRPFAGRCEFTLDICRTTRRAAYRMSRCHRAREMGGPEVGTGA